jgi:hypothetical protein
VVIIIGILVLDCLCVGAATGTSVRSARPFGTDSLLVPMAKASVSGVLIRLCFGFLYLDITPNQRFSPYDYPIPGKRGLPLCEKHGRQLEMKEVVVYDKQGTEAFPPDHCWVCEK